MQQWGFSLGYNFQEVQIKYTVNSKGNDSVLRLEIAVLGPLGPLHPDKKGRL